MDPKIEQLFNALSSDGNNFETLEERQSLIHMFNHVSQHVTNSDTSEPDLAISIMKTLMAYLIEHKFNLQTLPGFVPINELEKYWEGGNISASEDQRQKEPSKLSNQKNHEKIQNGHIGRGVDSTSVKNLSDNFSKPMVQPDKIQSSHVSIQEIECESVEYSSDLFAVPHADYEDTKWRIRGEKNEGDQAFLIGTLTNNGSIKKHLYLSDTTGRRLCHMVSPNAQLLDAIVLLTKWRFVHATPQHCAPFIGYIEALSNPVVLYESQNFAHKRRKLMNTKGRTNISGTVLCMTSCLRRKTSHYMIEVAPEGSQKKISKSTVLLSNESFPFWASCIFKGSRVTMKNLKRAKIKAEGKGTNLVLMATNECILNVDATPFPNIATSKQQVIKRFQAFLERNSKILEAKSMPTEVISRTVCPAYIGEVTGIISPELGIFALDNGLVILHCTYIACEDFGCGMRAGSVVVVYDAHFCGDDSTVHLICCSRSDVRVVMHSETYAPWNPVCVSINSLAFSLMREDCMRHPFCVMSMLDVVTNLTENFPFLSKEGLLLRKIQHGTTFSILERILRKSSEISEQTSTACTPKQDRFREVMSSPHECVVQKVLKQPPLPFHLMSIKELTQLALTEAENSDLMRNLSSRCWSHIVFRDNEINPPGFKSASWNDRLLLLGCLKGGKQNGKLQLADKTGAVDCVILKPKHLIQSTYLLCTKDMDSLIRIKSFVVVVESIMREQKTTVVMESKDLLSEVDTEISEASQRNRRFRIYLIFDADDVEVLKQPGRTSGNVGMRLGCRNDLPDAMVKMEAVNEESVTHKMTTEQSESSGLIEATVKPSKCGVTHNGPVEGNKIQKDLQSGFYEFLALICDIPPVTKTRSGHVFFIANATILQPNPTQNMAVKFTGDTVKWRPFLHAGTVIRICIPQANKSENLITIDSQSSVEHMHEAPQELKGPLEDAYTRWKESYYGKSIKDIHSIGYALLSSLYPSQTMSIQGRIVNRYTFQENGLKSRIEVTDLVGGQILSVYVHHQSDSPHNGLIPGSVVVFRKLNIYVSKQGNVYGKIMPTTDIFVDSFSYNRSERVRLIGSELGETSTASNTIHKMNNEPEGGFSAMDENVEPVVKDEGGMHTSEHILHMPNSGDPHNCSDIERAAEVQVPTAQIFNLYEALSDEKQTEPRIAKLHVRLNRVLKVLINPQENQSHLVSGIFGGSSFYAKCIAKDVSGRVCLHFGTAAAEAFFRFVGMDTDDIKEFASICQSNNSQSIEYNCQNVGCNDVTATSSKNADQEQTLAHSVLHLLCSNVEKTVMPSFSIIARERPKPPCQKFSTGAIGVGNFEQNLVSTYNLKLLQFDCVDVV